MLRLPRVSFMSRMNSRNDADVDDGWMFLAAEDYHTSPLGASGPTLSYLGKFNSIYETKCCVNFVRK